MSTLLNDDTPPWGGPDLLVEAKAAALKAGGTGNALPLKPRIRLSLTKPPERTWADVEARFPPAVASARSEADRAWLEKVRAQNALIAAERQAKGGPKAAPRRPKAFIVNGAGEPKGSTGRRGRPSKLTDAQVLEIWHSPDRGVALAERYGVGRVVISKIRTRLSWRHLTGHLGEPGRPPQKHQRIAPEVYEAIVADTGTIAEIAERHGVSTASVSIARAKAKEAQHLRI
ncbi:hypothetical protein SAMN05446927_5268 [Caballeronia arationis]|uniref:Uncharacterized protein n=1 Tax=Caballeronia arationis TaxID=1777142 RepID=A0A7Z7IAW1_9BURK|nr:hypothetical protein [Caballeronia arationis]SOE81966.1 hypothetical protein SAMN05446927_5268 [Caballeronia arationis]